MNEDNYFVEFRHRPRRVAFLVDVDSSPEALFEEIVEFNVSSWGGRYNPIIPVLDGQLSQSYWDFLKLADPDIVYTYCNLLPQTWGRILREARPLEVLTHNPTFGPNNFHMRIDHQATVLPVLSRIIRQFPAWARSPEPAALVFDYKDIKALSPFVRRNFGGNGAYYFYSRDHQIPSVTVLPDDKEVMKALTNNQNIVLPIKVCSEGPTSHKCSIKETGAALTLYYGASSWNFVEYWNRAHFIDDVAGPTLALSEMWVQPSLLQDSDFYQAFLGLLRRRVFTSDYRRYLRFVSFDETKEDMAEVSRRICADFKWGNLHPCEPVVRSKGELPPFETRQVRNSGQIRGKQVSGSRPFLEFTPPVDAPHDPDDRWIVDLAVENPTQERYYANKTAWWKLPRKNGVAGLFVPQSPCRVTTDHLISVDVCGRQQGILLNRPDLGSLFEALVLPKRFPAYAGVENPSSQETAGNTLYIRSSDKGMYARGVLALFESLQKAAYVFEHEFWRDTMESLSSPVASEQARNKVRKELEKIGNELLDFSSRIELIVEEVLDAAGRIQRPIHYTSFQSLFVRYWDYVKALPKEEQIGEVTTIVSDHPELANEEAIHRAARVNLRRMLSEMTARKIFLHGAVVRCDHCLVSLWYHVDELRSIVTCRGCRKELPLSAEIPWSYALNELVVSAVRDHGVVPVIRTAFRLFEGSRECFCFLPGIEIRDYRTNPEAHICELDLVWIRDGEFGIAEVKRTAKKLSVSDKLVKILGAARPNRFLLSSPLGTVDEMNAAHSIVRSSLDLNIAVDCWGMDAIERSRYVGWNTFAYSMFG